MQRCDATPYPEIEAVQYWIVLLAYCIEGLLAPLIPSLYGLFLRPSLHMLLVQKYLVQWGTF